jgi:hypothetical protein
MLARLMTCMGVAAISIALWPVPSFACRPFDGTDAAVAKPGDMEIELGPVGVLHQGTQSMLAAPATVINFGLTKNWEAVFEGRGKFPFSSSDDGANLTDVAVLLKGVLRRGGLQGQTGPSIATEFGVTCRGSTPSPGSAQAWPGSSPNAGNGGSSSQSGNHPHPRPARRFVLGRHRRGP